MWGQELRRKVQNKGFTENDDSIKNSFVWIRYCSTRCWVSSAFFVWNLPDLPAFEDHMSQCKEYVIWSLQNLNIYYPFGAFILRVCVYAQWCLTFCDPIDCSQSGSSVHGISQAILECVAISSSRGFFQSRDSTCLSCITCTGRWILYHCAIWEDPFILYSLYIFFLIFTISIHTRDYYLYYTAWKLNLREVKSIVQNHMTRTWFLNPSVISGTLNWKIGIIKCGLAVRPQRNTACQSTVKAIEHGADGHLCFLKESSPAFELEFHPVSEELNPPLGWIENLSVAVADWGMHWMS